MSAITPQTELRLIKCPIESDNRNQMTFASASAQYNYFNSLPHITADNFTYQRKDNVIRYPAHIDSIMGYNYVMYQNEAYTNKWFYAFITNMEYINDNMTLITIHTDVYQTWMFQMVWKKSFVEREHVNDDTIGLHTIPENLETGEYINMMSFDSNDLGSCHIVMGSTISPVDGTTTKTGNTYGGIFSGVSYFIFQNDSALNQALFRIADNGNSDSIVSLFYAPDWLTDYTHATWGDGVAEVDISSGQQKATGIAIPLTLSKIGGVGDEGYTFKNNKLCTFPYVAYMVSNNAGESVTYHLEDFYDDGTHTAGLEVWGALTPGCSIRLVPEYYKTKNPNYNEQYNNEYGLNAPKLPICSWGNDTYTNWLTQNGINFFGTKMNYSEWSTIGASIGGVTSMLSAFGQNGDVGSAAISGLTTGFTGIFNAMQQEYQHSFNSVVAQGNVNSGDVTFASGKSKFSCFLMSIKPEYAKIIDNYFSMYGYKINDVKIPNITGRTNWNYVKTIGANIEGDIPENHLNEIKSIFNNGVTLWHNSSTYLDYSQSNAIV